MATTACDFYRALMGDYAKFKIRTARADDEVDDIYPGDGVLYPRWARKARTDREGKAVIRDGKAVIDRADVRFEKGEGGVPMVQPGGGTSLHDVPGWFGSKEFWIPNGTQYPGEIVIKIDAEENHPTKMGMRGRHAQLEVSKPMTQTMFEGYLDLMARNAIAQQIALAKGKKKLVRG